MDPYYTSAHGFRVADAVTTMDTPIWDLLVTKLGDPIPHLPAPPMWPPDTPEETHQDVHPTGSATDTESTDAGVVADAIPSTDRPPA